MREASSAAARARRAVALLTAAPPYSRVFSPSLCSLRTLVSFPVSSLEVVSGKTEPSLAAFERRPTFLPDTSLPKSVIITRVGEADATGFCPALQSNQVRRAGFAGLAAHAHVPQAHPQASNSCGHTSSLRPSPCCPRVQSPAVAVTQLQESSRGKRVACPQHPGRGCVLGDLSEAQAAAKSQEVDLGRSCSPGSLAFSMPVTVVGPGDPSESKMRSLCAHLKTKEFGVVVRGIL